MKRAGSLTITVVAEGCPTLRGFRRVGTTDLKGFIRHIAPGIYRLACSHAEAPSSLLRIRILALHHFQLLSTAALAKYTAPAHLVSWKFWSRCGDGTPSWWSATWSCRSISIC